ncbi:MAG TPA: tetratricopeptide repeat protein [Chthoniobacteraceae bacterium]|nr:tetratricopeptide repeat protein [Chthoniobacteraceae bacterium]
MKTRAAILMLLGVLAVAPGARAFDDVDQLEVRAQAALDAKDYDLAIQLYGEAIKLSPNEAAPHVNRAAAYAAKGDTEKQLADYADAIRIEPDDPSAYQMRAKFYSDRLDAAMRAGAKPDDGDTDKALADYSDVMRIQLAGVPDPKAAAREAAEEAFKKYDLTRATACWRAVVKLGPNDAGAWFKLALFDELMLKPDKASADCNEALRLDPKNADAAALRAQIDAGWKWESDSHPFNQRDKHAAAGEYELAVDDCNFRIWLGRVNPWEEYAQRGDAYCREGKWENAVTDYTESLRICPQAFNDGSYEGRAYAYMAGKQYDKAAADFITAAAEWHKEQAAEAQGEQRTKEDLESENFTASQYFIHAAEAYGRGGQYDKAIALLKNDLKTAKLDNGWTLAAVAWLYATSPDAKWRDGAEAVKLAKRAGGGEAYFDDTLATAYAEAGQWDEAVKSEKTAIDTDKEEQQKAHQREADATKVIASGEKWTPTPSSPSSPQDTLDSARRYIKEDEEEIKEFTARLELYQQKKPCREMKEFEVGD